MPSGASSRVVNSGVTAPLADTGLVDKDVVELAGAGRRAARRFGHEIGDLARLVRVGDIEGAQPAVEEGAEYHLVRLPAVILRQVLPQIVRPIAAAAARETLD